MSVQVFAIKRFYPVWTSSAAIGRTGLPAHNSITSHRFLPTLIPLFQPGTVVFIFVHGESTFRVRIDVCQHPVVRKTTHSHLVTAQATSSGIHGNFL